MSYAVQLLILVFIFRRQYQKTKESIFLSYNIVILDQNTLHLNIGIKIFQYI